MPTWTVDHHGGDRFPRISEGDVVLTGGGVYKVIRVREIESRIWPDRWRVEARRLGPRDEHTRALVRAHLEPGQHHHELGHRYQRGERPSDFPCEIPGCEGCSPRDDA